MRRRLALKDVSNLQPKMPLGAHSPRSPDGRQPMFPKYRRGENLKGETTRAMMLPRQGAAVEDESADWARPEGPTRDRGL
jgi:hypothetical protein